MNFEELCRYINGAFDPSERAMEKFLNNFTDITPEAINKLIVLMILNRHDQKYGEGFPENLTREYLESFGIPTPEVFNCFVRNRNRSAQRILEIIENNNLRDQVNNDLVLGLIIVYRIGKEPPIVINRQVVEEESLELYLKRTVGKVDGTFMGSHKHLNNFCNFVKRNGILLTIEQKMYILACLLINKFDYPWNDYFMKPHVTRGTCEILGARIPSTMTNQYRGYKKKNYELIKEIIYCEDSPLNTELTGDSLEHRNFCIQKYPFFINAFELDYGGKSDSHLKPRT